MKLSDRINSIVAGGLDGWEVYYRARELREAGRDITMLTVGDHEITTPEPLIAAMAASARAGQTGYMPMPGLMDLRRAVAARLAIRTGAPCIAENVVIVPGGQSALFACMTAALDPGDACIHIDPYYATYPGTIRAAGGVPIAVPARPEQGFQPQKADLLATGPARALLVNSPNNPTGAVYSADTVAMLADFARNRDLWLISDEVYDGQVWNGRHISPRSLPGMAERTLVIGSLSKSHVMTGWRLGWIAGPTEAIRRLTDLNVATTYGTPGFIQAAGLAALTQGDAIEAGLAATYRRRRELALSVLAGANALRVSPPDGAMYVMIDIRATGMDGITFAHDLLDATGIAVLPGESFGQAAAGHVRVALTVEDEALAAALLQLAGLAAARAT